MTKEKKPFFTKIRIIEILILVVAGVGMYLWNFTSFFATNSKAPSNYLDIEDYWLIQDGEVQKIQMDSQSTYAFGNDSVTTKGATTGITWEKFVELYGGYYADYILAYYIDENDQYQYINEDSILVKLFDEEYVQSGILDPTEIQSLTVDFSLVTQGRKTYYTQKEISDAYREYYRNSYDLFGIEISFFRTELRTHDLHFNFVPNEEGEFILWNISSSMY